MSFPIAKQKSESESAALREQAAEKQRLFNERMFFKRMKAKAE